jgi:hypothetical protein
MKVPGAALLIALGLLLLYLATSGNLDRLGKAWSDVINSAPLSPETGGTSATPAASGILDPAAYHAGALMHSLTPGVGVTQPGGMN